MVLLERKVNLLIWLAESKSVTFVQRMFKTFYNKHAPHRNYISNSMKKFQETESVNDVDPLSGRANVKEE